MKSTIEPDLKVRIIEFSMFNGIQMMYATHYYVDGRRVSKNSYYQMSADIDRNYRHDYTRQWSDKNKNGVDREFTEIFYKKLDKPR